MLTQTTIDRIRRLKGGAYPVLSVYMNMEPDVRGARSVRARLVDMLRPIKSSTASMDHEAVASLRADIERILDSESHIEADLGHGIAIFACHGLGFFEYLSVPRKVWDKAVADATPYLRPLMAVVQQFHRCCVAVVDRRRSQLFEFYMGELEAHEETVEEGARKSNFGGWYGLAEYGVRHRAEETQHRHYRETVRLISDAFESRHTEILLVGGHRGTLDEFLPFLPPRLRDRLAGTFVVDVHTMTPAIVAEHCARFEREYERRAQRESVDRLMASFASGGNAVLGPDRVLDAANARAIGVLLVEDGVRVPGAACDTCGWLGLRMNDCPVCGWSTRLTPDVIDELIEITIDEGGTVEQIFELTPLREHSVGAITRFPLSEANITGVRSKTIAMMRKGESDARGNGRPARREGTSRR